MPNLARSFYLDSTKKPLPLSFFLQPTKDVAAALLGMTLVIGKGQSSLAVRIVETEAYLGKTDPASHTFHGPNKRNQSMFERGGTCYVYLSYGIHFCMNVVTGLEGIGEGVLLRAGEPLWGRQQMAKNRGKLESSAQLTNGPGKLTQALGIDLGYNGRRFGRPGLQIYDLASSSPIVGRSPRIGISRAKNRLLRFYIKSSPWVSRREA